jgi:hypothetical protein
LPNDFKQEKEIEVLITEYETLRSEMHSRLNAQTQITNIALLLIGGASAAIPFLFSFNSQGLHPTVPFIPLVIVLLVISLLFISLLWSYMQHMLELGYIGKYIEQVIRPRCCDLLEIEKQSQFFCWDSYHAQQLFPKHIYGKFIVGMSTIALYGVMGIPALLTLTVASAIYFTSFSIITTTDKGMWIILSFIIFVLICFVTSITCGIYIVLNSIKISKPSHDIILYPRNWTSK